MFCFHSLISHLRKFQISPIIFLVCNHVNQYGCHYDISWKLEILVWPASLLDLRIFGKSDEQLYSDKKRLVLLEVNTDGSDKMCFYSLLDRINFWDFGGHADYDEIRVELYGQTQVRIKLMSSKKDLYNSYLTVYP